MFNMESLNFIKPMLHSIMEQYESLYGNLLTINYNYCYFFAPSYIHEFSYKGTLKKQLL